MSLATVFAVVIYPMEVGSTTVATSSPVSVSFLPSGEGWNLSGYHCSAGACIKVERTMNDGHSWTSLPLPSRLRTAANQQVANYFPLIQQSIYFADAKNGWIYGSRQSGASNAGTYVAPNAEIWSTHDGGGTWSAIGTKALGMSSRWQRAGDRSTRSDGSPAKPSGSGEHQSQPTHGNASGLRPSTRRPVDRIWKAH